MAEIAGFDALKVNPLRGWSADKITFPMNAFEAPWRTSLTESLSNLWTHQDVMGFTADVFFFGYQSAEKRALGYAQQFPQAIGIDCPSYYGRHFVRARETECLPEKLMNPLHSRDFVCLDLWHIRGYRHNFALTEELALTNRIVTIDVQTRHYEEMLLFLQKKPTKLGRQLLFLKGCLLPETVSVSAELLPQHLWKLASDLNLSSQQVLHLLQERIRESLP